VRIPKCPGCTNALPSGELCCAACWHSVPTSIPGLPRVRSSLKTMRNLRRWAQLEDAHDTLRAWLAEHPIDRTLPVIAEGSGDHPANPAYRTGTSR